MNNQRKTCPLCNCLIISGKCSNRDGCQYKGIGINEQQRIEMWANHGIEEKTVGAYYDYTGRD